MASWERNLVLASINDTCTALYSWIFTLPVFGVHVANISEIVCGLKLFPVSLKSLQLMCNM